MQKSVTTYFLQMDDISEFKPKLGYKELLTVQKISDDIFQHWALFVGVGLPWYWNSRLKWSPQEWAQFFKDNRPQTYMVFGNGCLVGYFELNQNNDEVEIKFLGLFPSCIGQGFGGALLSHAVEVAWGLGAKKVWLHTCTSDHHAALSNYLSRGFKMVRQTEEMEEIPNKAQYLKLTNNFLEQYILSQNVSWL